MKRALLMLLTAAACSGQMCGTSGSSLVTTGQKNICGRWYYNTTYRVGLDPPFGIGQPSTGGTITGADLQ